MNRKLKTTELQRANLSEYRIQEKHGVIVVLDSIRSLHNIGAIFRTADALAIEKIYLCGLTATPPHKEIHKTALGATESVEWEYVEDVMEVVQKLQHQGVIVAACEQAEQTVLLQDFHMQYGAKKAAFIFGNEVFGVNQSVVSAADVVLEIPQFGTKHSFNVSVSAGIVLWEAVRFSL